VNRSRYRHPRPLGIPRSSAKVCSLASTAQPWLKFRIDGRILGQGVELENCRKSSKIRARRPLNRGEESIRSACFAALFRVHAPFSEHSTVYRRVSSSTGKAHPRCLGIGGQPKFSGMSDRARRRLLEKGKKATTSRPPVRLQPFIEVARLWPRHRSPLDDVRSLIRKAGAEQKPTDRGNNLLRTGRVRRPFPSGDTGHEEIYGSFRPALPAMARAHGVILLRPPGVNVARPPICKRPSCGYRDPSADDLHVGTEHIADDVAILLLGQSTHRSGGAIGLRLALAASGKA